MGPVIEFPSIEHAAESYLRPVEPTPDAPAEVTRVAFRVFPEGDVIALFPDIVEGTGTISSFQHVGQHGAASRGLVKELRPATAEESADLRRELESAPYHYRFADFDPPAPAGAPAAMEADPFASLAPGETAGWLMTVPRTPVAILLEGSIERPTYFVRLLTPGHGRDAGETAWYRKGFSVVRARPAQKPRADGLEPAGPAYHPTMVEALRLYQNEVKARLYPTPEAEADRDYASARDLLASEGSAVDPVTLVRNFTREACAAQLARARKIRAALRAGREAWQGAAAWKGENAPHDLADAQRILCMYREERSAFVAAAARAAAGAPPVATEAALEAGQVADTG
ncbi:hypothetical protein ABZT49_01240 [Methylobacterium sp. EM32]|uniref:hypothetical protein n=1 Tax=Methylobacterium sp. EM32 TaxID=3163481 RepID=UPI0033B70523